MSKFYGKRFVDQYTIKIAAKPNIVFPLLCPKREKEWLDGWSYEMIYSGTGLAELGCAFKTDRPGQGEAYWLMTKHVPNTQAEYTRFLPNLLISVFSMRLSEQGGTTTIIEMTYTTTSLSEQGNEFITRYRAAYEKNSSWLENALSHFIQTGNILKKPQ
ncbi:hypothetical protein SPSIL_044230 [Sporomusa silvacetica DSM 10669]|uniref:SRPBCC family protein n=1 Tax=Sporomusa silvacetica DSM 10669 TaxID=1123289 RepID=A0ABZ3IS39_9FIRM|nr:hypothetical protein [Sporomusa silvacetica]OZC20684.1 hypothetical protein SPSIL_15520 [Sporomusa silvacetica DSM 10669]